MQIMGKILQSRALAAPVKGTFEGSISEFMAASALSVSPSPVFTRRQLMRGSYTNASSIAITLSLLLRSTRITLSHVDLHRSAESAQNSHMQAKPGICNIAGWISKLSDILLVVHVYVTNLMQHMCMCFCWGQALLQT